MRMDDLRVNKCQDLSIHGPLQQQIKLLRMNILRYQINRRRPLLQAIYTHQYDDTTNISFMKRKASVRKAS